MASLDQAIALAVDRLAMNGAISVALVMKEVRSSYPLRKYTQPELIEAEKVNLRRKITVSFKEPITDDFIRTVLHKQVPPQYQALFTRVPTKLICISKGSHDDNNWVLFLHATVEQLEANYRLRRGIGRAVIAKSDEVQDFIEAMRAAGVKTPMDLLV